MLRRQNSREIACSSSMAIPRRGGFEVNPIRCSVSNPSQSVFDAFRRSAAFREHHTELLTRLMRSDAFRGHHTGCVPMRSGDTILDAFRGHHTELLDADTFR
jgi:hypothetical protein